MEVNEPTVMNQSRPKNTQQENSLEPWETPVLFPLDLAKALGGDAFGDESNNNPPAGNNDFDADFPSGS
ncbi:MAG: hypothetical protein AAF585_13390 [Verrucomicrobiota bacterium]